MLWCYFIVMLFVSCLADSKLVESNPKNENNIPTHNSENITGIASDEITKPENVDTKIPAVGPSEPILPVTPEAPTLAPIPQEIVTQVTTETFQDAPVKPVSLPIPDQPVIPNVPEAIEPQNPETTAIPTGITSGTPVSERLDSEVTENNIDLNSICRKRNTYYKVDGSCDAYIECREFKAQEQLCPDGLHYNPESKWPEYPCGYPMDVSCQGRGTPQQSNPTDDCPHQYGFYPPFKVDPNNCSPYRMCVGGKSIDMQCPFGLAFNTDISHCDWPENVQSCNSEVFLGFKCPPHPVNSKGEPLDIVINYKYDKDCHKFYSCHGGLARLLSCDLGFVFDAAAGRCADSDLVPCHSDQPTQEPSLNSNNTN